MDASFPLALFGLSVGVNLFSLFIASIVSVFCCTLFISYWGSFFVAKPRDWTPERHHLTKQGIPTMGGIVLIGVWILVYCLKCAFLMPLHISLIEDLGLLPMIHYYLGLLPAFIVLIGMGALGAYDDWSKIKRRGGISPKAKFIAQIACAALAMSLWYWYTGPEAHYLWIPLFNIGLPLGPLIIAWGTLVIVSASNAINLTDGLDGLAGTILVLCFSYVGLFDLLCNPFSAPMDVIFGSLVAAGCFIGFLCFNCHPARLFMGDTGALAFGALLGFYALQLNISLLLPFIALVPVLETLSVMLQVVWFKLYRTRIFKMAPLHHHFELSGYSEQQIVLFAALTTIGGIIIATLLRF